MAGMAPASPDAIAVEAGLAERYVREWLGAMVTGRIVEYDAESRTYTLTTPEGREALIETDAAGRLVRQQFAGLARRNGRTVLVHEAK